MSLIKSIGKAIGSVARVAAPVLAKVNPVLGVAAGALGSLGARSSSNVGLTPSVMPGSGLVATPVMGSLPALPRLGAAAGALGGAVVAGARAATRGAITLCRRHPTWCSTIGGTAAVAAMIESGQLPAPRRSRGRGLSSRDLRSYRRVHNLLAGFCAPKARIKKVCR